MQMASLPTALVLDVGSDKCRVGFAGQEAPSAVFPSVVGRARAQMLFPALRNHYVGTQAEAARGMLQMVRPVENGLVTRWNEMEQIWHHIFYNELRVQPEDHPVLITEVPLTPKADREQVLKIMFEVFLVPSLHLAIQAVLSLYASGRSSGLLVDAGLTETRAVPVCEGFMLPHALQRCHLGGNLLTDYLMKLLEERGWLFIGYDDRLVGEEIKEKYCYVAYDFHYEMAREAGSMAFELPSGTEVELKSERFRVCEALFEPSRCGLEAHGIHHLILNSVMAADEDLHQELCGNIVLAGGTTLFPGLVERLEKELSPLLETSHPLEVVAPENRQYSAWIGGSVIASLHSFQKTWIARREYASQGASIVEERCI